MAGLYAAKHSTGHSAVAAEATRGSARDFDGASARSAKDEGHGLYDAKRAVYCEELLLLARKDYDGRCKFNLAPYKWQRTLFNRTLINADE